MMLSNRFRKIIDGMSDDMVVSMSAGRIREWLDESGPGGFEPDFTVRQVADLFDKATSTVTAWIRAGGLRAYKLNGKEYRISTAALEEFRSKQSQEQ